MAIWVEASLEVKIDFDSRCSLRTVLEDNLDSLIINSMRQRQRKGPTTNILSINCDFVFIAEGMNAAKLIEDVCLVIKGYDKNAMVDCTASIRFLK